MRLPSIIRLFYMIAYCSWINFILFFLKFYAAVSISNIFSFEILFLLSYRGLRKQMKICETFLNICFRGQSLSISFLFPKIPFSLILEGTKLELYNQYVSHNLRPVRTVVFPIRFRIFPCSFSIIYVTFYIYNSVKQNETFFNFMGIVYFRMEFVAFSYGLIFSYNYCNLEITRFTIEYDSQCSGVIHKWKENMLSTKSFNLNFFLLFKDLSLRTRHQTFEIIIINNQIHNNLYGLIPGPDGCNMQFNPP